MSRTRWIGVILLASLLVSPRTTTAADKAAKLSAEAQAALTSLYEKSASAKALGPKAFAILVFPGITKAGFIVGGQHGDGALFKDGKTIGYYKTTGASFGLQAGAQSYGYALFFMNEKALQQLDAADGWELGTGPSVVAGDAGAGAQATTTTGKADIYSYVFGQQGLMGGIDLQGSKISKTNPK